MPAFATDVFGPKHAGTIYGAMLTTWSAGAIVGPLLIAAVSYRTALLLISGMVRAATVLPVLFNALAQHGTQTAVAASRVRRGRVAPR